MTINIPGSIYIPSDVIVFGAGFLFGIFVLGVLALIPGDEYDE